MERGKEEKDVLNLTVPISLGELIDKITILEIKKENMSHEKLKNINKELKSLQTILIHSELVIDSNFIKKLKAVNIRLWKIEDAIRIKENKQEFDNEFIHLARSVYKENDKRALIKKEINYTYNSELIEEKSYKTYKNNP